MTYLPTTPVWHDCSSAGTLIVCLISSMFVTSRTVTTKPFALMCFTHFAQHSQFGVLVDGEHRRRRGGEQRRGGAASSGRRRGEELASGDHGHRIYDAA